MQNLRIQTRSQGGGEGRSANLTPLTTIAIKGWGAVPQPWKRGLNKCSSPKKGFYAGNILPFFIFLNLENFLNENSKNIVLRNEEYFPLSPKLVLMRRNIVHK